MAEPDRAELEERVGELVAALSGVLSYHAGGIELESISPRGVVRLRFTGMCSHCSLRPLTLVSVLLPALEAVDGVTEVETVGLRISEEAQERLREAIHPLALGRDASA